MIVKAEQLKNTLFIDIETVSTSASYSDLNDRMQGLWAKKTSSVNRKPLSELTKQDLEDSYSDRAGIYSEFSKVVCISVGYLTGGHPDQKIRLKSFYGHDERKLLIAFSDMLDSHYKTPEHYHLCGHNIKEFDIPFLCRRMVVNAVQIPNMLDLVGKKPWEVKHLIDTLQLWKFGDYKNYTSLNLLTAIMDIPSPKDDIDGSEVGRVYWQDGDLPRIVRYCEKDVITVAQLALKWAGRPLLRDYEVDSITEGI